MTASSDQDSTPSVESEPTDLDPDDLGPDDLDPDATAVSSRTRLKQAGVILLGLALAGLMLVLGTWQFEVFQASGDKAVAARMAEPALDLARVAPAGSQGGDAFGRTVVARGSYAPDSQVLVPEPTRPDTYRVVAAFVQDNGTAVAVVRGVHVGPRESVPPPPTGQLEQYGIFLPSEPTTNDPTAPGEISSVRISVLAQRWAWPLASGFVTLDEATARTQGLGYEMPQLPREGGELRNGAYAVQWWVFAAFAVGFGVKMARDFGREDRRRGSGAALMG